MMASGDRISNLPDDLLGRILYFAPAKEAASTTALSRRWRTPWLSSGALNIESRFVFEGFVTPSRERDDLWRYAMAALHCRLPALRKLTFRLELEASSPVALRTLLRRHHAGSKSDHHLLDDLLADPSARRVEQLRVGIHCYSAAAPTGRGDCEVSSDIAPWFCELPIGSLPSEALRDLQVTNFCCSAPGPGGAPAVLAFPLLAAMRLHRCAVSVEKLQGMIDAAPQLATLHLDSVFLRDDGPRARLRCPAVTALVMADCGWELENGNENTGVELDAPTLRRFRYKGLVRQFSILSAMPDLTWVDLHLGVRGDPIPPYRQIFWQFVHNFSNTKALKLRVDYLEDIAITGDEIRNGVELLCNNMLFSNLERLDLEGLYKPEREAAGVAIANFLHCCPAIRVLRLNLSTVEASYGPEYQGSFGQYFLGKKYQQDFGKSVDCFLRRRIKPMINSSTDDGNEVSDVPGLSGHSFNCLQSSLRSLSLQFRHTSLEFQMEKANCFGVRLAKFFSENCIVLEEMKIDNGNQKMHEHINHMVGTWVANSSKRRNWPSTTFAVLPLERSMRKV